MFLTSGSLTDSSAFKGSDGDNPVLVSQRNCGPWNHLVLLLISDACKPLEASSAGLSFDPTCRH